MPSKSPFRRLVFTLGFTAIAILGCSDGVDTTAELSLDDVSNEASAWWASLDSEQQDQMMHRMQTMRGLADDDREEIRQRASYAGDRMRAMHSSMSETDRRNLMSLPPHERRALLQGRLKEMMVQRSDEICSTGGCGDNAFGQLALPDRFRESKRLVGEKREPIAMQALDQATLAGQISVEEASALKDASVEEVVAVLGDLRKKEMIASADAHGFWGSCGVNAEQKEIIVGLEPKLFVRAIMMLRAGVPSAEVCERCVCETENCEGMQQTRPGRRRVPADKRGVAPGERRTQGGMMQRR
ncbi:MAG: hypothetical protein HOM77_09855 [Planctomycetes bacterium]|nr:hypothetical protein [Planctomycetota bacterium]